MLWTLSASSAENGHYCQPATKNCNSRIHTHTEQQQQKRAGKLWQPEKNWKEGAEEQGRWPVAVAQHSKAKLLLLLLLFAAAVCCLSARVEQELAFNFSLSLFFSFPFFPFHHIILSFSPRRHSLSRLVVTDCCHCSRINWMKNDDKDDDDRWTTEALSERLNCLVPNCRTAA